MTRPQTSPRARRPAPWRGVGVLLWFLALTVGLSWPTVTHFTTTFTGSGTDALHNAWVIWHTREALIGNQPLFEAPLLYYPHGISMLVHAVGPVAGMLALPFWPLGLEAAYNGALLLGMWLTGVSMYLLGRGLGFGRGVALFAGTLLISSEMMIAGLQGHIEKSSVFPIPLTLLTLHRTLEGQRSAWWVVATALCLLLAILHAGWIFVLTGMAVAFFSLGALWQASPAGRRAVARRLALLAGSAAIAVGPFFLAILRAASDPALAVASNHESFTYQPDLIEFFLPNRYSLLFRPWAMHILASHSLSWSIETTVRLAWSGLLLAVLPWWGERRRRLWALLLLGCMVLALGPALKVLGDRTFTEYQLPLILPYALLTALPGFDFMRTPGQFMLLGFVAFAVVASSGLAWLTQRWPRRRGWLVALALLAVLLESWPQPRPQVQRRPIPAFYHQIAADPELYGVFDLPVKADADGWVVGYSAHAQMAQIVHGKGIAAGYLSRSYARHPLFPCLFAPQRASPDVLVNGKPSNCAENAQRELARFGYRYVVFHKPLPAYFDYRPGAWGAAAAEQFLAAVFPGATPIVDDATTTVYALPTTAPPGAATTTLDLATNWHEPEPGWRWAASPATLEISAPHPLTATLDLTLARFKPAPPGMPNRLLIETAAGPLPPVTVAADQTTSIPLPLIAGKQVVTLTLEAGNFRPSESGAADARLLSFAIRTLDLRLPHGMGGGESTK